MFAVHVLSVEFQERGILESTFCLVSHLRSFGSQYVYHPWQIYNLLSQKPTIRGERMRGDEGVTKQIINLPWVVNVLGPRSDVPGCNGPARMGNPEFSGSVSPTPVSVLFIAILKVSNGFFEEQ
jgi:hypothetical protein